MNSKVSLIYRGNVAGNKGIMIAAWIWHVRHSVILIEKVENTCHKALNLTTKCVSEVIRKHEKYKQTL